MFKNILLASDGSEHSFRAAAKAIQLAKVDLNSIINVVYVVDGNTSKQDVLQCWNQLGVTENRQKKLENIIDKATKEGIKYEVNIVRGEPVPVILKYALEFQTDVIVLGSRGLNRLQEMVLGSVSHKVAKRAKCPVLIVK